MEFLISPWFGGLSIISLLAMVFILWGVIRACQRHNLSPMGCLCGKDARFPNPGTIVSIALYVLLTATYIFIPPILHSLLS